MSHSPIKFLAINISKVCGLSVHLEIYRREIFLNPLERRTQKRNLQGEGDGILNIPTQSTGKGFLWENQLHYPIRHSAAREISCCPCLPEFH
jgi:hypothetical protein